METHRLNDSRVQPFLQNGEGVSSCLTFLELLSII